MLGQGADNVIEIIRKDTKMYEEIKKATIDVASSSSLVREDTFGTDEVLPEDFSDPSLEPVEPPKVVNKKK